MSACCSRAWARAASIQEEAQEEEGQDQEEAQGQEEAQDQVQGQEEAWDQQQEAQAQEGTPCRLSSAKVSCCRSFTACSSTRFVSVVGSGCVPPQPKLLPQNGFAYINFGSHLFVNSTKHSASS